MKVKLENQILMKLYKEQVATNGLKTLLTIIPEKSHASYTKEEVNESTIHSDKGKIKVDESKNDLPRNDRDRPLQGHVRDYDYGWHAQDVPKPTGPPRVWDHLGGKVTHQEKIRPHNWVE